MLYGYRREYDAATGALVRQVPDEVTAPVVREVARRVLAGETPYAVAVELNLRGVPTPRGGLRGWDLTQVKRLCVNPGYAGFRVHRGMILDGVDAQWDPLIGGDLHRALVTRLGDSSRGARRDSAVKHLLSGIAACGANGCGARMRVLPNRGGLSYICPAGFHTSRRVALTDAVVVSAVVDRLAKYDVQDVVHQSRHRDVAAALAEAKALRDRMDGFVSGAASGGVSPESLAKIEAVLLPQIVAAEGRAAAMVVSPLVLGVSGQDADSRWDGLSLPQRRAVIRELVSVRVLPVGRGRRVFRPESVEVTWRA
jgi:hypothetical protein